MVLKHCHAAAATYILEAGKHRADKSTLRYRIYLNIHLFSNATFMISISVLKMETELWLFFFSSSTYLEDCKFDRERIELFCTEYQVTLKFLINSDYFSFTLFVKICFFSLFLFPLQNNKNSLEILLGR